MESAKEGIPTRISELQSLTPREEALLIELMDLRRERIRLDRRIREVLMLQRIERGLPIHRNLDDPSSPQAPCHCLRCDYAWYPADPTRAPKCCSRCGTTEWMLPPTATSRKPGDPPAESWARRKSPRTKLRERAKREKAATVAAAEKIPEWRSESAPVPPPDYPWDRAPLPGLGPTPTTSPTALTSSTFPPPPSITAVLPPPPDPAAVSLSARLREFRAADPSPEQPERMITAPPMIVIEDGDEQPLPTPIVDSETGERVIPLEVHLDTEIVVEKPLAHATLTNVEIIPEQVPPESVGVPQSDAEREELAKAQEAAWPTTRPE